MNLQHDSVILGLFLIWVEPFPLGPFPSFLSALNRLWV